MKQLGILKFCLDKVLIWPKLMPSLPDVISNHPYCLPYSSFDVSLDNLVLDQIKFPKLIFFSFLSTCLLVIVFDIVRRNSVSVTHENYRV